MLKAESSFDMQVLTMQVLLLSALAILQQLFLPTKLKIDPQRAFQQEYTKAYKPIMCTCNLVNH